jgi:hypothetical protein
VVSDMKIPLRPSQSDSLAIAHILDWYDGPVLATALLKPSGQAALLILLCTDGNIRIYAALAIDLAAKARLEESDDWQSARKTVEQLCFPDSATVTGGVKIVVAKPRLRCWSPFLRVEGYG